MKFNLGTLALGLRITQAILIILILALSGHVANFWTAYYHGASPSQVNFLIFDSVWSILALAYLVIVPWRFAETVAHHKFIILGLEAITMVFWLSGFLALAVFLKGRVCNDGICSAVRAADVFAAFNWLAFIGTLGLTGLHMFRARKENEEQIESKESQNSEAQYPDTHYPSTQYPDNQQWV